MPARVEPVIDTMSTSGCELNAVPTVGPSPYTRLNTPGGTPASCRISAMRRAECGVYSEGFKTTVQPQASAGMSLFITVSNGQFHGEISAATPIGSLRTIDLP